MREKELRLALVCYGGISLAVYMHGITKEVWHLARASRAFYDRTTPTDEVETAYVDLLDLIETTTGTKLRVLPDIVAGASAGGINGIFLAQAVASGQSLDPLTDLWLERADVDALLDPAARAPSRVSKLWASPIAWAFAGRQGDHWDDGLDAKTRDEIHAKLTRFVRSRWFEPPFGGEVFDNMLLDAFGAMEAGPRGPRLLPDEQPLDLFVTVTDFSGHPEALPIHSPPTIVETEHRLTLSFRDEPGTMAQLGEIPGLVFAARATASFPGAFPPFTVAELDSVLDGAGREWPGREAFLARVLPRQVAAGTAETTALIDGSVLANAPFRPAIDALRDRPARREVDRRFVYIDPKPGQKSIKLSGDDKTPGFFTTLFGALSDIPRTQPIRDNLEAIAGRTARIARTRRIVEALRPDVETSVEHLFGRTLFLDRPTSARLATWRARAGERAARDAGHSYVAYREIVRAGIADALEHVTPLRIGASVLLHELAQRSDLSALDLRYRIRRLRFVARRLAVLADETPAVDYEGLRKAVFACLARYLERESPNFLGQIEATDARTLLDLIAARWDLARLDAETDAALAEAIGACFRTHRRQPLLAYLGFPFYDVATLALLQGEGFDEFDPVMVDRIAPEDATSLSGGAPVLKGIQFNSFGAFFSRAYRENDYLWGRLHGAERLIDIVMATLPPDALGAAAVVHAKCAAFGAILDREGPRLTAIPEAIVDLRNRLAALAQKPA
ncbi:patatin-like protein [Sphingomonas sp. SUN039]|uniref:patatin-like protein n=1 Tax=Sphingomonas sp. SUN039 TaxID=2937787 RepID=UPI002164D4A0|nr:patatin-like protein [Sphingomonas sp. SUN039]UVO52929.1 patatin-like protein [Sphingomonas sp. SUN039]